eukprot:GILJ01010292.1.p1 GENE.GILJ01010292.1~~GILJ01010292.1.p1  ORF type:complete len:758 (+),score=151.74 GILJ01010292.1:91-2364(+)
MSSDRVIDLTGDSKDVSRPVVSTPASQIKQKYSRMMVGGPNIAPSLVDQLRMFKSNAPPVRLPLGGPTTDGPWPDNFVCLGAFMTKVLNVRTFKGAANPHQPVRLLRDAKGPDSSAIRVVNMGGQGVGYVSSDIAEVLAGLLDQRLIHIEGVLQPGFTSISFPLNIFVYGFPEHRPRIGDHFNAWADRIAFRHQQQQANMLRRLNSLDNTGNDDVQIVGELRNPYSIMSPFMARPMMRPPPVAKTVMTVQDFVDKELDKLFQGMLKYEEMPEMTPSVLVRTPLYSYQKQALHWMTDREKKRTLEKNSMLLFWEKKTDERTGKSVYYNTLTCATADKCPQFMRGGMLADDMGLGKTLQIIALIATSKFAQWDQGKADDDSEEDEYETVSESEDDIFDGASSALKRKRKKKEKKEKRKKEKKEKKPKKQKDDSTVAADTVTPFKTGVAAMSAEEQAKKRVQRDLPSLLSLYAFRQEEEIHEKLKEGVTPEDISTTVRQQWENEGAEIKAEVEKEHQDMTRLLNRVFYVKNFESLLQPLSDTAGRPVGRPRKYFSATPPPASTVKKRKPKQSETTEASMDDMEIEEVGDVTTITVAGLETPKVTKKKRKHDEVTNEVMSESTLGETPATVKRKRGRPRKDANLTGEIKPKSDPNSLVGIKFKKKFAGFGVFEGVVQRYRQPYFRLFYPADNDTEEVTRVELEKLLEWSNDYEAGKHQDSPAELTDSEDDSLKIYEIAEAKDSQSTPMTVENVKPTENVST